MMVFLIGEFMVADPLASGNELLFGTNTPSEQQSVALPIYLIIYRYILKFYRYTKSKFLNFEFDEFFILIVKDCDGDFMTSE
jgi:hypothetical protein